MYVNKFLNFVYFYYILKTFACLIVMPIIGSSNDTSTLTPKSLEHYRNVRNNRRIKGNLSILLGLMLGIFIYIKLGESVNIKKRIIFSLFVCFFSMNILYEAMWQDKFIFEEKNIEDLRREGNNDDEDMNDVLIYSTIYKKHRLAGNIIEVSSIGISLILSLILDL